MKKASWGKRLIAYIVDIIIFYIVLLSPILFRIGSLITFAISLVVALTLLLCKDAIKGRSIGKRILGLYVRDYNDWDAVPKIRKLIQRNAPIYGWFLWDIMHSGDDNGRHYGDKRANTIVLERY